MYSTGTQTMWSVVHKVILILIIKDNLDCRHHCWCGPPVACSNAAAAVGMIQINSSPGFRTAYDIRSQQHAVVLSPVTKLEWQWVYAWSALTVGFLIQ